jgi:Holliday junction resolvase RusA-like endonuclease
MMANKIILDITPQTSIRSNQGDKVFFRIPRNRLRPPGLKRLLRLERYNEYKVSVLALAKQKGFTIPTQGASFRFYIPVPPSWRPSKKRLMHGKLHQSRPDLDNILKGIFDAMLVEDKHIAHIEAAKFWVNQERGWIEISITDPIFPTLQSPFPLR